MMGSEEGLGLASGRDAGLLVSERGGEPAALPALGRATLERAEL